MLAQLEPMLAGKFPPGNMWFGLLASSQALLASGKGDQQRALLLADRGVSTIEGAIKIGGQGADQLPIVLIRRASIELQAERPSQAAADALRAVNLLQSAAPKGTFSSHIGAAYLELGQSLQAEGKVEEARGAFRSATEHLEKTLGPDDQRSQAARRFAGLKTQ